MCLLGEVKMRHQVDIMKYEVSILMDTYMAKQVNSIDGPSCGMEKLFVQQCDALAERFKLTFHSMLPTNEILNRKWPSTWWDAFKVRWFPNWLLRRYPPMYETMKLYEVLSGIKIPKNYGTKFYWYENKLVPMDVDINGHN